MIEIPHFFNSTLKILQILFIFSSIGVCCPVDISDRSSAVGLPSDGEFDAVVWGDDNDVGSKEAIVTRPEERGS